MTPATFVATGQGLAHGSPNARPVGVRSGAPGALASGAAGPRGLTGPTEGQAKGPHWRRTSHGFYLPSDLELRQPEQRIVEAGVLLPSYGGVTGWAALHWLGGQWFNGLHDDGSSPRDVDLAVRHGDIRSQPGIHVTSERLTGSEFIVLDGLSVAVAVRAVLYEMRYAPNLRAAVVVLDMAASSDLVSIDEVSAFATPGLNGWNGIPLARRAVSLGDENSWSPQEVYLRLHWTEDAGFPRPLSNHPVFDRSGRHIGTPDLLDVEAGVVGEYDGALHLAGQRRAIDLRREDAFRRVGLEYFTMVAADKGDPERIVRRMREVRARARWEAESTRAWNAVPPPWWVPTVTVEQRRALTEAQRARFLRRRSA
jgi:hypothetical protein